MLMHAQLLDRYQEYVRHATFTDGYRDTLLMASMGVAGEGGEVVDMVKKIVFHKGGMRQTITTEQTNAMILELGDVLWYVACLCNLLNVSLAEVMDENIVKLRGRYPQLYPVE